MVSLQQKQSTNQWWNEWQRAASAERTSIKSWKPRKQPSIGQHENTEIPRKKKNEVNKTSRKTRKESLPSQTQ